MQVEAAQLWDVQTTALQIIHLAWWRAPGWFSKEAVHKPRPRLYQGRQPVSPTLGARQRGR